MFRSYDEPATLYGLLRDLYCAAAVACVLWALHRIADGLLMSARVSAFQTLENAYTPEEREMLIHRVKQQSMHF